MYYETRPEVLSWLDAVLTHRVASVRRQALMLLESVDCAHRREWIDRAEHDDDPTVAAAACLVRTVQPQAGDDLLESDFAASDLSAELEWEWEYAVRVCRNETIPNTCYLAWTREEDDAAAVSIALQKANVGRRDEGPDVAVIVRKRLVNRFTRSPRNYAEALAWHRHGRPHYLGDDSERSQGREDSE